MAKFTLHSKTNAIAPVQSSERVRIGSISVFALVVIICLAVLAVLAFSTANASLLMSQRQAVATSELYLDERAAQEFVAGIDDILAGIRGETLTSGEGDIELARDERGNVMYDEYGNMVVNEKESDQGQASRSGKGNEAVSAVSDMLLDLREEAKLAGDGKVAVTAQVNGNKVNAEFSCENGRMLSIVVTIRNNATYRIDKWKMSAVQNEEQPEGQLLILD